MARGKSRWPKRSIRSGFPIRRERQRQPRFDGAYAASDGRQIRFSEGGNVDFGGEPGVWKVDQATLWVSTSQQQYEGALDPDAAYLLGSADGHAGERIELELHFKPDD
jgi:hypothetical protein